jgi:hypothetical protein
MRYLPFLLLLASCVPFHSRPIPYSEPIDQHQAIRTAFNGHPPVVTMDLEAAPDSIATVVAEYYYLQYHKPKRQSLRAWFISNFHPFLP